MLISLAGHTLGGFRVLKPHSKRDSETFYEVECIDCGVSQTQPGSRLTLGSAKCKSEYHDRAIANRAALEIKREFLAEVDARRKQASDQAERDRAAKNEHHREALAEQYRELSRWLLQNADPKTQDSFYSQIPLQEWLRGSDQNRELIVQIFKKEKNAQD